VLPFAEWMHGPLAAEVTAALGDAGRLRALGLDPEAVRGVWSGFIRGQVGVSWSRPWAIYALMRWAEAHGINETVKVEPHLVGVVSP
jgi:hypothetical protein